MIIQDQIDKEIQECTFLTIQVDETTDVTKEQLSAIIRLDRNGEIVERFLKFVNVRCNLQAAPAITAIVKEILNRTFLIVQYYHNLLLVKGTTDQSYLFVQSDHFQVLQFITGKRNFKRTFLIVQYYLNLLLVKGTFQENFPVCSVLS